jgi:DNA-binding MarR family transcriptional regulator
MKMVSRCGPITAARTAASGGNKRVAKQRPNSPLPKQVPAAALVSRPADGAAPWQLPGSKGENLQIFDFPTFFFGRLTGLIKRSLMTAYTQPYGLTIPEWRVFASIAAGGAGSVNEVCGLLVMDRGQVSRTLPALVRKGLVTQSRVRRDGKRRRGEAEYQTRFAVTADGRTLFRQALPVAQRHQMILLSALDEHERSQVYQALLKMLAAAEQFENFQTLTPNPRQRSPRRGVTQRRVAPARDAVVEQSRRDAV